ncbi:calcium-activated SK potassium channel domain-containing protein [Ditylenchus destructor]|uniref:Calcium-activated SK potassium channel domain-containing protein n=1 Tax=Ditylenchus destructor TaxID=166010 RepID=A0AAD4MTD4_9BILA|nr:calcium-activated SK potassium channel domain-containing protein [Ditylenchus destructor]
MLQTRPKNSFGHSPKAGHPLITNSRRTNETKAQHSVGTSEEIERDNRKRWSQSPSSFHQSFDDRLRLPEYSSGLSNSCSDLTQEFRHGNQNRRGAFCSGGDSGKTSINSGNNVRNFSGGNHHAPCTAVGSTASGQMVRPPPLGNMTRSPQSSIDGDVGQISMGLLRMNGAIAPFKTLLNSDSARSPGPHHGHHSHKFASGSSASTTAIDNSGNFATPPAFDINGHRLATAVTSAGVASSPSGLLDYARRKESWSPSPFTTDRGVKTTLLSEGDHVSKKSLSSLVSHLSDVELQKVQDEAKPMKEKGGRLIQRQYLFHVRRETSDYALIFALIGIVLMIIENELSSAHIYERGSFISVLLRSLILLSTIVLVAMVIKFHIHEVQLFMNANSAEDWRIAVSPKRCAQMTIEVVVCGICPLPVDLSFNWTTVDQSSTTEVPIDVLLSIPMFFRLFWVCRVMLLHSRLFTDASSRSIAGLNRVNFNARFVLKTLMTLCPGTMLMVFTASLWVVAGWILRLCERHHNYLNSLWLIAITFLSVGYGDIVPNTYCGRIMAVVTGILGTCTSSMVVAVIARKLELTRAEKHVHNFMMDTQLTKQLKHSAANVLRETWLIYKHRRLVDKIDTATIRHHQRKFLVAICALRKVKHDQRKLQENSLSLGDVAKIITNTYEIIHDISSTQEGLALRITTVEHQLLDIQRELGGISEMLKVLVQNSTGAYSRPQITSHMNMGQENVFENALLAVPGVAYGNGSFAGVSSLVSLIQTLITAIQELLKIPDTGSSFPSAPGSAVTGILGSLPLDFHLNEVAEAKILKGSELEPVIKFALYFFSGRILFLRLSHH